MCIIYLCHLDSGGECGHGSIIHAGNYSISLHERSKPFIERSQLLEFLFVVDGRIFPDSARFVDFSPDNLVLDNDIGKGKPNGVQPESG